MCVVIRRERAPTQRVLFAETLLTSDFRFAISNFRLRNGRRGDLVRRPRHNQLQTEFILTGDFCFRATTKQTASPKNAPLMSTSTSFSDAVRDGTND